MTSRLAALLFGLVAVLPSLAEGTDSPRQILDHAKQPDETTRHWGDRDQKMKLTIIDRRGAERVRVFEVYERKYPGQAQKSIVFFMAPAEVTGTAFLAFNTQQQAG
jgi:hypothetical protein